MGSGTKGKSDLNGWTQELGVRNKSEADPRCIRTGGGIWERRGKNSSRRKMRRDGLDANGNENHNERGGAVGQTVTRI